MNSGLRHPSDCSPRWRQAGDGSSKTEGEPDSATPAGGPRLPLWAAVNSRLLLCDSWKSMEGGGGSVSAGEGPLRL